MIRIKELNFNTYHSQNFNSNAQTYGKIQWLKNVNGKLRNFHFLNVST